MTRFSRCIATAIALVALSHSAQNARASSSEGQRCPSFLDDIDDTFAPPGPLANDGLDVTEVSIGVADGYLRIGITVVGSSHNPRLSNDGFASSFVVDRTPVRIESMAPTVSSSTGVTGPNTGIWVNGMRIDGSETKVSESVDGYTVTLGVRVDELQEYVPGLKGAVATKVAAMTYTTVAQYTQLWDRANAPDDFRFTLKPC